MTRRRSALAAGTLVAVLALVGALLLLGGGDREPVPARDDGGPVAAAYVRAWNATCTALRDDASRTTAAVRDRLGDGTPSAATRRRLARRVVVPYLGRTERRLLRLRAAVPPPPWRAHHRETAARLTRTAQRAAVVRERVRTGDLGALGTLDPTGLSAGSLAPTTLAERTPACSAPRGV